MENYRYYNYMLLVYMCCIISTVHCYSWGQIFWISGDVPLFCWIDGPSPKPCFFSRHFLSLFTVTRGRFLRSEGGDVLVGRIPTCWGRQNCSRLHVWCGSASRQCLADDLGPWFVEERRGRHIGNRYRSGMQNGVDKWLLLNRSGWLVGGWLVGWLVGGWRLFYWRFEK